MVWPIVKLVELFGKLTNTSIWAAFKTGAAGAFEVATLLAKGFVEQLEKIDKMIPSLFPKKPEEQKPLESRNTTLDKKGKFSFGTLPGGSDSGASKAARDAANEEWEQQHKLYLRILELKAEQQKAQ